MGLCIKFLLLWSVLFSKALCGVMRADNSTRKTIEEGDVGYNLAQFGNPDEPGVPRKEHNFIGPNGQCSPDQLCIPQKYRSFDGSCNNLNNPWWGRAGIPGRRLLPPRSDITKCGEDPNSSLPNPRKASWLLLKRGDLDKMFDRSLLVMVFGQVIDHDITLTPLRKTPNGQFLDCCFEPNRNAPECCPIIVPPNDPFYSAPGRTLCLPFIRSQTTSFPGSQCNRQPDIENSNTAFMDLSILYGSDEGKARVMRSFSQGQLAVTLDNRNRPFPHITTSGGVRMIFGDNRSDVQPGFTLIYIMFMRNHNRIATALASLHPEWSDDTLYFEARKINSAIFQNIIYTQFIDALLGEANDVHLTSEGHQDFYNPNTEPTISLIFNTAAYRLHTLIGSTFWLADANFQKKDELLLRDIYLKPLILTEKNNFNDLARGLALQNLHEFNNVFTTEMTEWLFPDKGKDFGSDIASLNIQRGRDHKIRGYIDYKELCGLGKVKDWSDLSDFVSQEDIQRLSQIYQKPEDIDMYIGQNMEKTVFGSMLGPTAFCYVREQFLALRNGDRYFFTRPDQFSPQQVASIRKMTLARLFCDNVDNTEPLMFPFNVFKALSGSNPPISCSDTTSLPALDLNLWQ